MMEFSDIERILALVREHELAEFELERDGLKLRVRKASAAHPAPVVVAAPTPTIATTPNAHQPAAGPAAAPAAAAEEEALELAMVKSPIVGTFYRSPEPGAPPFV